MSQTEITDENKDVSREVPALCRFVEAFPDMEEFHASDNFFGDDGVEAILRVRTGLLASQGRGGRGWVTQL